MADNKKDGTKLIAQNKKAYHDFFVEDSFEAGIALYGTEVKSIRCGGVNLKDSYCRIRDGELFAYGIHISPYEKGNIFNRDPMREKKLLMHRKEINKLLGKVTADGMALVPLALYFSGQHVKVKLGLCRGKKLYDKRESEAKRQADREIEQRMKYRMNRD